MGKMETEALAAQVPVVADVDVLVVGGGPAGIAAALAAAKNGSKTLIVEQNGYLGGMATAGMVQPIMTAYDREGETQIVKGLFDEFVLEMEKMGGAIHPSKVHQPSPYASYAPFGHDHVTPFDPEIFKIVAFRMMRRYGIVLKLHSVFIQPLMNDKSVRGAIIFNKSGFEAVRSAVTVDCTGDADVCRKSGCRTVKGREKDGLMQPVSLFFRVRNVDEKKVDEYMRAHPYPEYKHGWADQVRKAKEAGELPSNKSRMFLVKTLIPGIWACNASRLHNIDSTNADDLTRAQETLREQVLKLVGFFNKYIPGFEKVELLDMANSVGVRESCRIVGEHVLSLDDINNGTVFDDAVALGSFWIDIHGLKGDDDVFAKPGKSWYQIPYRSLVPLEIDNLLAAGRCLSATHEAAASARVMTPCFATGQAAGTAAALAVKNGIPPRKVD
ncbi:MAG TPA: FAD-dependent oxidoreductase, partial [Spirochaetia bacterium]|nr:FAD-dependent oxidoreductase [Spirochaetia bacterium]